MKNGIFKRMIAALVALTLIMANIPVTMLAAEETAVVSDYADRLTDPATLNSWKKYFGALSDPNLSLTTEYAGGIWSDKSVFVPDEVPAELTGAVSAENTNITIADSGKNFMVALSAISSNKTITGYSTIPTDTVFILDMSSSMRYNDDNGASALDELAAATNDAISRLQALNKNNRVAVVLYAGNTNQSFSSANGNTTVLLPLDTYTASNGYLEAINVNSNVNWGIRVKSGVTNSKGAVSGSKNSATGTFMQDGIYEAMRVLLGADPIVETGVQAGTSRIPIMVLMTDGEPTLANNDYNGNDARTDLGNSVMYNYDGYNHRDTIAFMTQLTAAFAKREVTRHYETDALMYTLAYGEEVTRLDEALSVMDPRQISATINGMWDLFLGEGKTNVYTYVQNRRTYYLQAENDTSDPLTAADKLYVDEYFPAETDEDFSNAFSAIVDEIILQSKYYPTYVEKDHDHDGYLTFTDKIGGYMDIVDIKGMVIGSQLFSGATVSKGFVDENSVFGTLQNPTALGNNLVWSIQQRLNISEVTVARELLASAFAHGQLSYTDDTDFSNYIGWYSDKDGNYLGFWYDGILTAPPEDATHIIKSYLFLGNTDAIHGISNTDMLYSSIRVARELDDFDNDGIVGETLLTWKIPASLIPTLTYQVGVDVNEDGNITDLRSLTLESENVSPIRLVYEVAFRESIYDWNLTEKINESYKNSTANKEAGYVFYTNQWKKAAEGENTGSDTTRNTYSHFEPSQENERFYYTADTLIYVGEGENKTLYTGSKPTAGGSYYRAFNVYEKLQNGTLRIHTHYEQISDAALALAQPSGSNWIIPKGTIHRYQENFYITKTNTTGTLPYEHYPTVVKNDVLDHYYIYAVLGNNGKLTLTPATGIKLTKTVSKAVDSASDSFTFTVSGGTGTAQLIRLNTDGTEKSRQTLTFADSKVSFAVADGETVYLIGLTDGTQYTITEENNAHYSVSSVAVNGDAVSDKEAVITAADQTIQSAQFVNSPKGYGSLTVNKEIIHPLGVDYVMPAMDFVIDTHLVLDGSPLANKTYDAVYSDGTTGTVTTDENGWFRVTLAHGENVTVHGLPEGTVANGTEKYLSGTEYVSYDDGKGWYPGFAAPEYWDDDGTENDDQVVIVADQTVTAGVVNRYTPAQVTAQIALSGTKTVEGGWPNGTVFGFELQKWDASAGAWVTIATDETTEAAPGVSFSSAAVQSHFTYSEVGTYSYQVIETVPTDAVNNQKDGVTYTTLKHTFSVTVTDEDMDGSLEIKSVTSDHIADHSSDPFELVFGVYTNEKIDFVNYYNTTATYATLDVQKELLNPSGSDRVDLSGYQFVLYAQDGTTEVTRSGYTDVAGETQLIWTLDTPGEYSYILKEVQGSITGMSYFSGDIAVTVEVEDNQDGTLSATVTAPELTADGEIVIENSYAVGSVDVTPVVNKELITGDLADRELNPNEFTFLLKQVDVSRIANYVIDPDGITAKNDSWGNVTFPELTFEKVGIYYFEVSEVKGSLGGISYDEKVYHIRVTVTDGGEGKLVAVTDIYDQAGNDSSITFRNTYAYADGTYQVRASKKLTGRTLKNGEFAFKLVGEGVDLVAVNDAQGNIVFDEITYTKPGTYQYVLSEVDAGQSGMTYDGDIHTVTVTVYDNKQGQLIAEGTDIATPILFENSYETSGSVTVKGQKYLQGAQLEEKQFTFELYSSNAAWSLGSKLTSTTNAEDGSFSFTRYYSEDDLDPNTGIGTYYYIVKEENGGTFGRTDDQRIDYDDRAYHIVVTATDNGNGTVSANAVITLAGTGAPVEQLDFVNTATDIFVKDVYQTQAPQISIDGQSVSVGDTLTYEIFFANAEKDAVNVTITDTIPNGTKYVEGTAGNGSYANGVLTWNLTNVPSGQTVSVTFDVTVENPGVTIANQAVIEGENLYSNTVENYTYKKTVDKTSAEVGDTLTYELSYTNFTGADAEVTISDQLDTGLSFLNAGNGGSYDEAAHTVVWELGTVAAGETVTVTFSAGVNAKAGDAVENTGSIFENAVKVTTNTVTTDIERPNLTITKTQSAGGSATADKLTVQAGDTVTYYLTVKNIGEGTAKNITVTDTIPAGLQVASIANGGVNSNGTITWTIASLTQGREATVSFTVTVPSVQQDTVWENIATVISDENGDGDTTDPGEEEDSDEVEVEVKLPRLSIGKTQCVNGGTATTDPMKVEVGDTVTYFLTVTNTGTGAAGRFDVSDTVPAGLTVAVIGNNGTENNGSITWSLTDLNPGESTTVSFTVTVPPTDTEKTWRNVAVVTYDREKDGESETEDSNEVIVDIDVPNVGIIKTQSVNGGAEVSDKLEVKAGDTITYTLTVRNYGAGDAADITVTDQLPEGLSLKAVGNGGVNNNGVITWHIDSLAGGTFTTVSFEVTVPAVKRDTQWKNIAAVTYDQNGDGDPENEKSNEVEIEQLVPKLSLTKTQSLNGAEATKDILQAKAGDKVTYYLTLNNRGNGDAEDVSILDMLPDGLILDAISDGGTESGGLVIWDIGSLKRGESVTVSVSVIIPKVEEDTLYKNVAVKADGAEEEDSNEVIVEQLLPELEVSKTQAKGWGKATTELLSVEEGDTVTYYLTVKNVGKGTAEDVILTDVIPAGLTLKKVGNDGSHKDGTVGWHIGTLESGEEITVSFTVTVPTVEADTTWKNIATAIYDHDGDGEPDPENSNEVEIFEYYEDNPKTGDDSDLTFWLTLCVISFGAMTVTVVFGTKKCKEV